MYDVTIRVRSWLGVSYTKMYNLYHNTINVNGVRGRSFTPARGLQQGNPLIPFLFLICSEGRSALLRLAMDEGRLKGEKVSRGGPHISHFLFANDSIIFKEVSISSTMGVKVILHEYEMCLGQCINFEKSTICFSSNTVAKDRTQVMELLGMKVYNYSEKYLRLPNLVG